MFEQTAVFERGVGEVTDIVEKELFRIAPRTEEAESWALRPEPTAGIVRAYVQHGMQTLPQPVKLTMTGPMFRYDRPQAGRYRAVLAVRRRGDRRPGTGHRRRDHRARGPLLSRGRAFATSRSQLNSIGDAACRPAYLEELAAYYRGHVDRLPALEQARLERNPLRLLDSKDPAMAELNAGAPRITDRLCEACAAHFAGVRAHLDALGIGYTARPHAGPRPRLLHPDRVRVLHRRARGPAAGAGRRRPLRRARRAARREPTPGIGFGLGMDRVVLALEEQGVAPTDRRRAPWPSSWAPTPTTRSRGCGSRRISGRRGCGSGPTSRGGSSVASWKAPARTAPTSRSSWATSSTTARSSSRDLDGRQPARRRASRPRQGAGARRRRATATADPGRGRHRR